MRITRRTFVAGAALGLAPGRLWSGTSLELGAARIDTLSDGNLVLPRSFALSPDIPEAEAAEILSRFGLTGETVAPECNLTLFRDGTNTVLFDVGAGPNFMPSAGKLAEALDLVGLDPAEVTHVVFTHAHPDHLWGVLDDFDEPVFPEAQHLIGRQEWGYWMDPATLETIGEQRLAFAAGAQRLLGAIEDRIGFFDDGDEVVSGIGARLTPGHTPGHMAFKVETGGASAMVLGDCVGNHHLALVRPDWHLGSDQDPEMAARTRQDLLPDLASEGTSVIGYHLPEGGLGRIETDGEGYRFVPA